MCHLFGNPACRFDLDCSLAGGDIYCTWHLQHLSLLVSRFMGLRDWFTQTSINGGDVLLAFASISVRIKHINRARFQAVDG